jgi:hypothetical protein
MTTSLKQHNVLACFLAAQICPVALVRANEMMPFPETTLPNGQTPFDVLLDDDWHDVESPPWSNPPITDVFESSTSCRNEAQAK